MFEWIKKLFRKSDCLDCGWFVACDACSDAFDAADEKLELEREERMKEQERI